MIIALHGASGAGKDTVAKFLTTSDYSWDKYAFASPLKRGVSTMLNIPLEDMENPEVKNAPNYKYGRSIRYILQTIGTEWGRNLIAQDLWMQVAKENIDNMQKITPHIVITDCRFENEADLIHEMGGKVIKIVRPDNPYTKAVAANGVAKHASEMELPADKVDYIVTNTDVEKLFDDITNIVAMMYHEKHDK